jgi:hypothetical protein
MVTVVLTVNVNSNTLGVITNVAGVSSDASDPNPANNAASTFVVIPSDFNGNGIDDRWEQKYGYGQDNAMIPTADDDHDGIDNYDEYLADTNPEDPASYFHATALSNNPRSVCFPSSTGRLYSLEWRADVAAGSWTNVPGQTDVPCSTGWMRDTNADPVVTGFYRVRVQMP